jgi:hypothetical protein
MLTEVLEHDTVTFREFPWQQIEDRHDQSEDQAMYMRRLMAIGLERATIIRVPTLDWPTDLFADVRLEIAA